MSCTKTNCVYGFFARGAPAILTGNVQPTKLLANGSMGFMHSLTLTEEAQQESTFEHVSEYAEIELSVAPYAINFQLSLPDGDQGEGIESLTSGAVVVPIIIDARSTVTCDTTSLHALINNIPKSITVRTHMITLGFALTDYKLQGKTLKYLILNLTKYSWPPHMDLKGLYVLLSRVKKFGHIRLLNGVSKDRSELSYLLNLRHRAELAIWSEGYDDSGRWSPIQVEMAANRVLRRFGKAGKKAEK